MPKQKRRSKRQNEQSKEFMREAEKLNDVGELSLTSG
jgi:hypothetical protein